MTRVIHTGDTHLGYRQYHSPERRRDFADAFRRVVADATAADVDAVVHAGDLFHDRRPDLADLLETISILRDLAAADVPFLAIVGNHESTRGVAADGAHRDAQWLDLFETLGLATRLDASGTRIGDTVFYGLDHVPRSKRDALDYEFEPRDAPHAALVGHGQFEPLATRGSWDVAEVIAESNVAFDAVLLGDEHAAGTAEVEDTWVTYCGSTERTSAGEREERGYNIVGFDGEVRLSRRGIETRRFVFVDLELHDGEGVGRVLDRLREERVEDAVVVVTLDGAGEPVTPAEVERLGAERGALVTRVNDRRELADPDAEVSVSFADPDEAVRERVRELGLSEAAHRVDRAVRDDAIADSNVRDRVERAVRDLLEEDPDAFRRVPDPEDEAASDAAPDETGTGPVAADGDGAGIATGDATGDPGDGTDEPDAEADSTADGPDSRAEPTTESGSEDESTDEPGAEDEPADDGQATWEAFE